MTETRILLIDDEAAIRNFIRISVKTEGFSYFEARTASEGINQIEKVRPHLVILDLGLPDKDGFSVLENLRHWSNIPVLVLTARDEEDEKVRLLQAGANDYLSKPFGIRELIARIRVLLRDMSQSYQCSPQLHFEQLSIDIPAYQVLFHNEPLSLSKKEFALLCYLARHAGQLVTQRQLLFELWGQTHTDNGHYLRIFISHLRKKLNDTPDNPKYIQTEPGIGYRFVALPVRNQQ